MVTVMFYFTKHYHTTTILSDFWDKKVKQNRISGGDGEDTYHKQNFTAGRGGKLQGGRGRGVGGRSKEISEFLVTLLGFLQIQCIMSRKCLVIQHNSSSKADISFVLIGQKNFLAHCDGEGEPGVRSVICRFAWRNNGRTREIRKDAYYYLYTILSETL